MVLSLVFRLRFQAVDPDEAEEDHQYPSSVTSMKLPQ
jgi:hypothetical protein